MTRSKRMEYIRKSEATADHSPAVASLFGVGLWQLITANL